MFILVHSTPCALFKYQWYVQAVLVFVHHTPQPYRNLVGELFFSTNGCLCTLGMSPSPIALRMALAIFLWFFGRRPVSLECFTRPVSVMYSDIIVKFCGGSAQGHTPESARLTLYSRTGLIPSTSNASLCGFFRPVFHFFCSVPDRSCGE